MTKPTNIETGAKNTTPRAGRTPKKARPQEAERIGGPRSIADLMPRIGGAAFRRFGFVQSSIVTRWAEIAGDRYAALSLPESIRFPAGKKEKGTLSLIVMGGHAPIIQHVIPEIIERVNRFFGYEAVVKVAIRPGEITRRSSDTIPRSLPVPPQPVPDDMNASLRAIADPELRTVLEAMAQGLANTRPIGKIS
ncbi:MAG: DUF721 domain-containing protein [Sphingobium sp.]|nr:DUF721 domain-containing protein [Sphingobium sp.]